MCPLATAKSSQPSRLQIEKNAAKSKAVFGGQPDSGLRRDVFISPCRIVRYSPIISLSKFVMATPAEPELSKSATSTPMPARALPSLLKASPASTAASLNVPLRWLR